jgi:hypothetical protein
VAALQHAPLLHLLTVCNNTCFEAVARPCSACCVAAPGITRALPYLESSIRKAAGQARTHLPQPMQLTSSTNTYRGVGAQAQQGVRHPESEETVHGHRALLSVPNS